MNSGIYIIRNNKTQKFYIGSAVNFNRRKQSHLKHLKNNNHTNKPLQNSWNKHGEKSFEFYIAEYVKPKDLIKVEQKWLNLFDGCLYNICKNAGSTLGTKHSLEERIKNRNRQLGKKLSEEHKKNISLGVKRSNLNKILTPEIRQKYVLSNTGENNPMYGKEPWNVKEYIITFPNGKQQKIRNLIRFCKKHKLWQQNLCKVAKGERNHHKHFKCVYV